MSNSKLYLQIKEKESVKGKDKIQVKDKELKPDQKLENQHCRPILILFPTRLGLKNIAEEYRKVVLRFFTIPQCIGILGGHPNQAHYFFGSRNDNTILFLDPHKQIIVPGTDIYAEEYITANFDRYY
ncbi:MAG: hypothetical protein EZS28_026893 [Streblomastix strix]|uniref:Cysteine protease n=1 Tax=Streblomastix strix TaxID=222440 RepID=A0A5J4V632_9EUKA|nr:MAG: hypothetical protein EZS28_026893 [Streblomastix strix]